MNLYFGDPTVDILDLALQMLDDIAREPAPTTIDDPIFLSGLGWRTGSTLLQRALMTDPDLLVWGEPMDRSWMLAHLTQALQAAASFWPNQSTMISERAPTDLAREWVALLAPDSGRLKAGLRSLFDTWLAQPAYDRGFKRWGVKEVRWTGKGARVLKWLYPNSELLLIVRDPVSSYNSILSWSPDPSWELWVNWPTYRIHDLESYGAYWNHMALSWAAARRIIPVRTILYEELVRGEIDLTRVGTELGLRLRPEIALTARIGSSAFQREMNPAERERLLELTAAGRAAFGYG